MKLNPIPEEQELEAMPENWPIARKIRWRLLHGEQLNAQEVTDEYGGSDTRIYMAVNSLRSYGIHVDKVRREGQSYYFISKQAPRQPRKVRANGNGKKPSAPPGFDRPAPPTPALGTVLRVVMVAEEDGAPAAVLVDAHGAKWFAHLEQAP